MHELQSRISPDDRAKSIVILADTIRQSDFSRYRSQKAAHRSSKTDSIPIAHASATRAASFKRPYPK
jgi:hypothetical protein